MFQHPVNFQDIPMTDTKRAFSLLPTVITLAWPTMLENIMATAVQYIDTAMVGTLGTRATAAVGSTMTINWLLGGSLYAFGVGFLAYISQARGAGDQDRIRSTAAQAVMMVIVVGGILTVLTTSLSQLVPVWMRIGPAVAGRCGLMAVSCTVDKSSEPTPAPVRSGS